MFSAYVPGRLTVRVTFPVASVLEVLASFSLNRTSTVALGTGRFFSSITERWITQVRISPALEAPVTPHIAIHSRNTPAAVFRSRADGDRCAILAIFIRMRMARKQHLNFTIVFLWADKYLSSTLRIRHLPHSRKGARQKRR